MKAVLFDIGNVLLFFDHRIACRRAAALCGGRPEDVRRAIFESGLEREYDEGRIPTAEFIARVRGLLGTSTPDAVIADIWCDIFWENLAVTRLVRRLAPAFRLVLLSNTNEMHMRFVREQFPVFRLFSRAALSYEVGHRKPAAAIFHRAIAEAGVPAGECAYVDDVPEYCQAGQAHGLRAIRYAPGLDLEALLRSD